MIVLLVIPPSSYLTDNQVFQERSFFGVYRIYDKDNGIREIVSGTTVHGTQVLSNLDNPPATTYYYREGPVGQVFTALEPQSVGVVGLGAGTLATYANTGDDYTFWEIDQLVVDVAEDRDLFTYLSSTQANIEIRVEDGRHGLFISDQRFDVLVIDAFGSDAIPVHLLTAEAMQVYLDRLAPGGTLIIHISNRHFELAPVVAGAATEAGASAFEQFYSPSAEAVAEGASISRWVAVVPEGEQRAWMESGEFQLYQGEETLWTDDYSNVLGTLNFD